MLLDTDVLIDYLRGEQRAAAYLEERTGTLVLSAITVAELFADIREGEERRALDDFVRVFEVVAVSPLDRRDGGGLIRRDYKRSTTPDWRTPSETWLLFLLSVGLH